MNRKTRRLNLVKGGSRLAQLDADLAEPQRELARIEANTKEQFHEAIKEVLDQAGNRMLAMAERIALRVAAAKSPAEARRIIEGAVIQCIDELTAEADAYFSEGGSGDDPADGPEAA